jgi:hypothetical protein
MRYVYPYKKTNGPDTLGLSIKSVLQADPQAQIFIVGDPYPVGNHIAISSLPIRGCDVTNKMMHFAWHYDGDFMYMNDDFFITKEFNPYLTYTSGEMLINDKHSPTYQEAMQNTIDFLKSVDKPTMNYECHMPVVLNSDKLIGLFDRITWKHHNHFIKSMYLNYYECDFKSGENVKVSNEIKKAQEFLSRYGCFSTSDTWFNQKAQREFITKHLVYSA